MTQEEFDYKHQENWEWYKLWNKLFWVFVVLFVISLFTDNLLVSTIVICAQFVFVIFEYICKHRHHKLHERWEAQDGK